MEPQGSASGQAHANHNSTHTPDPNIADIIRELEAMIYNSTVEAKLRQAFYRGLLGFYAAVFACAVLGNCLMLYAVLTTWRERKSLNHRCFYLNLIVCDLLVALIILPATCIDQLDSRWFLGEAACKLRHSLSVSLMCSSVFTLTCLSWLRSLGVSRTVVSWLDRRRKVVHKELLTIGSIWLAAIAISVPAARVSVVSNDYSKLTEHPEFGVEINWPVCKENWDIILPAAFYGHNSTAGGSGNHIRFWYGLGILNFVCLLPLLSLGLAYFRICRAIFLSNRILNVHKRCEAIMSSSYHQASDTTLIRISSIRHHFSLASTCSAINRRKRLATSRRMFLLGVALVMIFAATWLPMQCLQLHRSSLTSEESSTESMHKLVSAFHLLALTNCLFNPYFLIATHSLYRRRVRRLTRRLQCFCCGCTITWHFVRGTDRVELQLM